MYIWVVLTTFLAILAAFALPMRQDTPMLIDVPVAEAHVVKLVARQKAVLEYMKRNAWPFWGDQYDGKVNYETKTMAYNEYKDFMTISYKDVSEYTTNIYCLDNAKTNIRIGADSCTRIPESQVWRVVFTYGPIPEKWQLFLKEGSGYKVKPSADFVRALRAHFVNTEQIGYVEKGSPYIVNYEQSKFEIPAPIWDDSSGIQSCLNVYGTCLAYMIWR